MKFSRLACAIAQLVSDAGPDITQFFGNNSLVGGAQTGIQRRPQVHLAYVHTGRCVSREILDVDDPQANKLHRQLFRTVAQLGIATNDTLNFKRFGGRRHRNRLELDPRAAIIEPRLVNFHALVAGGVVDLDPPQDFFSGFQVVNDDFAGKQLGHPGSVVLHNEFFQLHGEGQVLDQDAVALVQNSGAGLGAFSHHQVAAKGWVAVAQTVLWLDVGNPAATAVRGFTIERHLRPNHQVPIKQPAQTHQNDGAVGCNITKFIGCARFGGHHPTGLVCT